MNKAGLFGGGWEDYLDALNEAFDRHVAENAPPHPFGASVDAIMTGYRDDGDASPMLPSGTGARAYGEGPILATPASYSASANSGQDLGSSSGGLGRRSDLQFPQGGSGASGEDSAAFLDRPDREVVPAAPQARVFQPGPKAIAGIPNLVLPENARGVPSPYNVDIANGNVITKPATVTGDKNSEAADQLTAFRNLMASPTVEGRRNDVYPDSLGIPTVGIGHKVVPSDNLTVGDVIADDRVNQLFAQDGSKALDAARAQAAQAGISDPEFILHLASVNLQLGTHWISPFSTTWGKIVAGDYAGAADGLNKSKWARQTPVRVQQFQRALLALPPKAPH